MQNHVFFTALAYGVSAVLLLAEIFSVYLRWRKARAMDEEGLS